MKNKKPHQNNVLKKRIKLVFIIRCEQNIYFSSKLYVDRKKNY